MDERLVERARQYWTSLSGPELNPGCGGAEIRRCESRIGRVLPQDMKQLYECINGFNPDYRYVNKDPHEFTFWPIDEIQCTNACSGGEYASEAGAENTFLFADHLDFSWGYAIRITKDKKAKNPIAMIGSAADYPPRVAENFTEFISLILINADSLYPG